MRRREGGRSCSGRSRSGWVIEGIKRNYKNNISCSTNYYEDIKLKVKEQINYDYILSEHDTWKGEVDGIVEIISDIYVSEHDIRVNGQSKPVEVIRSVFKKLDVLE